MLKEVAEALNSAPTEQRAAADALSRMAALLGVETGWVWLRDSAADRFYSAAAQNLPPYLQEPVRMTGQSCWCLDTAGYRTHEFGDSVLIERTDRAAVNAAA